MSLLYPPYLIALGCIHMACVVLGKDCKNWFAELNCDLDKVQDICKHILNLYELWKNFNEKKEMSAVLARMPKPHVVVQPAPPAHHKVPQHGKHLPPPRN